MLPDFSWTPVSSKIYLLMPHNFMRIKKRLGLSKRVNKMFKNARKWQIPPAAESHFLNFFQPLSMMTNWDIDLNPEPIRIQKFYKGLEWFLKYLTMKLDICCKRQFQRSLIRCFSTIIYFLIQDLEGSDSSVFFHRCLLESTTNIEVWEFVFPNSAKALMIDNGYHLKMPCPQLSNLW